MNSEAMRVKVSIDMQMTAPQSVARSGCLSSGKLAGPSGVTLSRY